MNSTCEKIERNEGIIHERSSTNICASKIKIRQTI